MKYSIGNSLMVQWLELCAFTAEGLGSIPGRAAEISQAVWCGQKKFTNTWSLFWECTLWPRAATEEDVCRRLLSATLPGIGSCNQEGALPRPSLPGMDRFTAETRGGLSSAQMRKRSAVSLEKNKWASGLCVQLATLCSKRAGRWEFIFAFSWLSKANLKGFREKLPKELIC